MLLIFTLLNVIAGFWLILARVRSSELPPDERREATAAAAALCLVGGIFGFASLADPQSDGLLLVRAAAALGLTGLGLWVLVGPGAAAFATLSRGSGGHNLSGQMVKTVFGFTPIVAGVVLAAVWFF